MNLFCVCFFLVCATSAGVASDVQVLAETMMEMMTTIETLQAEVTALNENVKINRNTIQTLRSELEIVKTTSEVDTQETADLIGASYVRWGRKTCDGAATLVYEGYVAGSLYNSTGGGSNHICLPNSPQFNAVVSGTTGYSVMYGMEYDLSESNYVFLKNNSNFASADGFTAACVLCHSKNVTSVRMIPALRDCPFGWTKEYQGYVMSASAASTAYYRTNYICVDEAPENSDGGLNHKQGILHLVEMGCGTLPCSVYIAGTELNCVVCSR